MFEYRFEFEGHSELEAIVCCNNFYLFMWSPYITNFEFSQLFLSLFFLFEEFSYELAKKNSAVSYGSQRSQYNY